MPYLALDVGGTKTDVGLVTADARVIHRARVSTPSLRHDGNPLSSLIALSRRILAEAGESSPAGVGIALPGPVDWRTGRMLAAPTIPEFAGVPLAEHFAQAFECRAVCENDANACALAEARWGAGRGIHSVAYFTISTGIGGGLVVDGEILRGARGTAAEFGHQVIQPAGGPLCDCGGHGCLEALASGRGIARRAAPRFPDALAAAHAARAGDPAARALWEETARFLGLGIANVVNIVDPAVVVLGGGVGLGAADLLLPGVRDTLRARCMPHLAREVPIVPAGLGEDLGILSAACLAIQALPGRTRP